MRKLILAAALVIAAVAVGPANGAWRSYWIEAFHADIAVGADGAIDVSESIRFYFDGSYNGIFRDIPLRYDDDMGFNYRLRLTAVSVSDDAGTALRYELEWADGGRRRIRVYVPGARDAARTVLIRYRVERALRFFPEHDELYWNVTGADWGVPIQSASARVMLPAGATEPLRSTAFIGRYGSRGDAFSTRTVSEREIAFATTRGLEYGEEFTVVVGWQKGLVAEPAVADRAAWLVRDNWPLAIPPLVFLLMALLWRNYGRDPEVGRSIMPIYHPPADFTPAELGTLVDERVDQRDIVATVVDLAVRGYLRIEEEVEEGWLIDTTTTTFERLKRADESLRRHEKEILAGLFKKGDRVTLDDLKNDFYSRVAKVRDQVYEQLVADGYFRSSPQDVRRIWTVIGALVIAASLPAAVVLESVAGLVAGVVSGALILGFAWIMPARTREGRHKWVEIKGFEEFLGRTEGERLRDMKVDVRKFEAYLPYAMALGVAENWGKAFEGMLEKPPDWYVGSHRAHFSAALFAQRMGAVSSEVGSAMTTAPRSSSGSSGFSSGGGFSGGGFGGGGGGAF